MTVNASTGTCSSRAAILMDQARELCGPIMRAAVSSLSPPLQRMAGYHLGWQDSAGTAGNAQGGKALRAALTIATAEACGGTPDVAAPAAAAIEILHNFTLIHDDVMDEDPVRRGRAAVWQVWGTASAILAGDALHALAFQVLHDYLPVTVAHNASRRLGATSLELCRGQHDDCAFEQCTQVTMRDYMRMAMCKTAALMGCACAVGALCVGADAAAASAADSFGRELGLAFQFVDDIIGIWGDPAVTGKPAGNDLIRRKRTLPVVAAMSAGGAAAAELISLYSSPGPMTPAAAARAAAMVTAAGGRRVAEQYADEHMAAALEVLPDMPASSDLLALAHLARHRER